MIAGAFARAVQGATTRTWDSVHPRDPVLKRWFGTAGATTSGVQVDEEKALGYDCVWRAVNLISSGVAKLPLITYRATEHGKEKDREHFAYRILRKKPNSEMTAGDFKRTLQHHAMLWGNGYAYIDRDQAGRVRQLVPLLPDRTKPVRVRAEMSIPGSRPGQLIYVTKVGGETRRLLAENVLHIHGLGFDGTQGYSVVELLAEAIGMGIAAREFGSRFFGQGAVPSGVVTMPEGMDEPASENFVRSVREAHSGLGKAHLLMVLEEGASWQATTIPPEQAQFLQTREFEVRTIANIMGVQPHKIGDRARTSYNSLEQANQEQLDDGLDPWLCTWEDECEDKLLTEEQKESESHMVEFEREGLVRVNFKDRTRGVIDLYNNGLINQDEGRVKINMPPVGDEGGAKFRKPSNIEVVGEEKAKPNVVRRGQEPEQDDSEDRTEAHRAMLADSLERAIKKIGLHARRAAKKPPGFCGWLDGFHGGRREPYVQAVATALAACRCVAPVTDPLPGICEAIHRDLSRAAETCNADALADEVGRLMDQHERSAREHAERAFGGATDE